MAGRSSGRRRDEGGSAGSTDLNSEQFSPVAFLNEAFAAEPASSDVEPLIQKLKLRVQRVDSDMVKAVRHQAATGTQAQQDLSSAKDAIHELAAKVGDVQQKANESEHMVENICKDIKRLDLAKQHLTSAITTFRRLGMLINAAEQLESKASKRQYRECATLLDAVSELSVQFEGYEDVPKVAELRGKLNATQSMLRSNVLNDFGYFGKENISDDHYSLLEDACHVVNAMDSEVRQELVNNVCQKELTAYNQIFNVDKARLDRVERRYNWFKRELQEKHHAWSIFPSGWQVQQTLCEQFCKLTRAHVAEMLDSLQEPNVQATLQAMHKTIEFEKEMDQRFGTSESKSSHALAEFHYGGDKAEAMEDRSAAIRNYYRRDTQETWGETSKEREGEGQHMRHFVFIGAISSCFELHLGPYVEMEEKQLHERLDSTMKEEDWQVQDSSSTQVLQSASQVFMHIKKVLNRCASLTTRKTLFDLHYAFKRTLIAYASRLKSRLPGDGKGTEKDDRVICLIINTAEYCGETVDSLSESLENTLDEEYKDYIDLTDANEAFTATISAALGSLVTNVEARMDPALQSMLKMNWSSFENVGDQSDYVDQCTDVLRSVAPTVGPLVSTNHFLHFMDKLAADFCPKIYNNIFKCKRFNETGAQQLLLDVHALKTALLEVPNLGTMTSTPTNFARRVSTEMGKAESLLKVILSPAEGLASTFRALLPESTLSEFKQVLELKGVRKAEQAALIDEYSRATGQDAQNAANDETQEPEPHDSDQNDDGAGANATTMEQKAPELNLRISSQYAGASSAASSSGSKRQRNNISETEALLNASNAATAPLEQAKSGFVSAMRNARSMMKLGEDNNLEAHENGQSTSNAHPQRQYHQQTQQQQQQNSQSQDRWRRLYGGGRFTR